MSWALVLAFPYLPQPQIRHAVVVPCGPAFLLQEETDELVLADEECMDLDPEYLPRRLLTDFAIYNAEVGCEGEHGGRSQAWVGWRAGLGGAGR